MKRSNEETNAICWFEIPVEDSARAKKFYETILGIEMQTQFIEETKEELTFFPFKPGVVRATSGKVSGVLTKTDRNKPAGYGTIVYLDAEPPIQKVIDKVESAGGKVLNPKKKIMAGYFAVILDTEGNRVGLFASE